ncbi:MAG: hypothetical protein QNJ13_11980 [Paracoccaceae bacterium]|nr:hypothetical protein [Paracoccaceae bacterium]
MPRADAYLIDPHHRGVILWRWTVFLLAAGYCLYQLVLGANYDPPGGPFRFLTIWALVMSFWAASRMLAISERRTERSWSAWVGATAVVNALVVLLYWRLWFEDPALVNAGAPVIWHQEYYLHLLGPVLQWVDALFVYGALRRLWQPALLLAGVMVAYIVWIEAFVSRSNDFPYGDAATGFPYPFLNDLSFDGRLDFYLTTAATGFVFLGLFGGTAWLIRRVAAAQSAARSA